QGGQWGGRAGPAQGGERERGEKVGAWPPVQFGLSPEAGGGPMAVVEKPEKLGLKPATEFDEANETWPRGDRPAGIRQAAGEFRARFATEDNRVRAVRTVDIASAGYSLKFAFGGAAHGANPYINIINPPQVAPFED